MKNAKLFICHHPVVIPLYKNMAEIARKYDKDAKIILLKINHEYFSEFDIKPYEKYFDEIIEFDFIGYKRNFFVGFYEILKFKNKLKKTISESLRNFEVIDLFLADSAWLPVNILLYSLSRQKNIKSIVKISFVDPVGAQTKINKVKSFFCFAYTLFFKCYRINVITTLNGKFVNFVYALNTPGNLITIINPTSRLSEKAFAEDKSLFAYPIISKNIPLKKRDMVIIFGDSSIFDVYSEYLPSYEVFVKKMALFMQAIEKKYPDCKLYFKPHPSDGNKIMPGIDIKKYNLLDNSADAQVLFDRFGPRIRAVYAFSSFSIIFGSFFSIPSYFFYRCMFNGAGINKFDSLYHQDNLRSKFIFFISDLKEIGKIDNLKKTAQSNTKDINNKFRKLLKV